MSDAEGGAARRVWAAPAGIAAMTACGLVGALVGDGVWDALACALLAGAVGYGGAAAYARARPGGAEAGPARAPRRRLGAGRDGGGNDAGRPRTARAVDPGDAP